MIPKIIHYCWLSGDAYPRDVKACIKSWKKFLPDYEIWLWDLNRFPLDKHPWVKEAFELRKYAFAADYIRIYALYNYGGIYLDSDVEVLKSFNDLLDLPYFIGQENSPSGIEAATIGAEPGNPFLKKMLDSYEDRHFKLADGTPDISKPLPYAMRECIEQNFKYHLMESGRNAFIDDQNIVNVFPVDFFSPKEWYSQQMTVTENTYSIHHFASSWMPADRKPVKKSAFRRLIDNLRVKIAFRQRIKNLFG